MTRLGDVTGLGGMGVPTFQAVRPWSRSLSVSQGKGLTPMAATVSALLESVELDSAERLRPPPNAPEPLARRPEADRRLWRDAPRDRLGIRLDEDLARPWSTGVDLDTGRPAPIPYDLLLLDFTRPPPPDLMRSSAGLATGNDRAEALAGAVAELVEHDLTVRFERLAPPERRALELDLASVDVPSVRTLLRRIAAHGFTPRAWSIGGPAGVPAFWCSVFPSSGESGGVGPAGGSACHPSKAAALAGALLEAAQSWATLVAGARDDLVHDEYGNGERRQFDLLLGALSFGPGPLAWRDVPDRTAGGAEEELAVLLRAARRLTSLPVLAFDHPAPNPGLRIVHAVAPGLTDLIRERLVRRERRRWPAAPAIGRPRPRPRHRQPVLFAGPSLPRDRVPPGVDLRPPAVCGDLAALLADPPPAVGLVDGCFEVAPTVWHKEVLELLAAGVRVLGAASLGAIRAAELAPCGMEGVGLVYALYAAGLVRRDDAVMLVHAPAELDHRPLSLSLVDAEAALLATPMPAGERRRLQRIARTASYAERSWPRCLRRYVERHGRAPTVSEAALAAAPSLKERDAGLLAAALLGAAPGPPRPAPPRTAFIARLMAARLPPAPTGARSEPAPHAPAA